MTQYNFKGWNFKDWFFGNWPTIKEGVKVGAPAVVTLALTGNYWAAGFGAIAGKFVLDSVHYWAKE